jgi:hypothetical protein
MQNKEKERKEKMKQGIEYQLKRKKMKRQENRF